MRGRYTNMYGCELWGYKDDDSVPKHDLCRTAAKSGGRYLIFGEDLSWAVGFFFLVFVFLGAMVLLTLFIGVVQVSIQETTEKMNAKQRSATLMMDMIIKDKLPHPNMVYGSFLLAFDYIDVDKSGKLSSDELIHALKAVGFKVSGQLQSVSKAVGFQVLQSDKKRHAPGSCFSNSLSLLLLPLSLVPSLPAFNR
jgi:hypothetical protein